MTNTREIVRSLVAARLTEDDPDSTHFNMPDDRINPVPTDKQMLGAIGAASGMMDFGAKSMTSNLTGAARGLLSTAVKSGTQAPGMAAKVGDYLLSGADKLMGAGGKFYKPGVGSQS